MNFQLLIRRYALAFLDNINEKDYDQLRDDIAVLQTFIKENPRLINILQSVITPRKMKMSLLDVFTEKQDSDRLDLKKRKYWRNLFIVLVQKHRVNLIEKIIAEIEHLLLLRQNKAKINIFFAREHGENIKEQILKYVSNLTGKELIPHFETRPEIIGGFIATLGCLRIDGSVSHNLLRFSKVKKT